MLEAHRGHPLLREGTLVCPLLLVLNASSCPRKWSDLPSSGKGQAEKGAQASELAGVQGEDFVPWVPTDTEGPQDLEEEE